MKLFACAPVIAYVRLGRTATGAMMRKIFTALIAGTVGLGLAVSTADASGSYGGGFRPPKTKKEPKPESVKPEQKPKKKNSSLTAPSVVVTV